MLSLFPGIQRSGQRVYSGYNDQDRVYLDQGGVYYQDTRTMAEYNTREIRTMAKSITRDTTTRAGNTRIQRSERSIHRYKDQGRVCYQGYKDQCALSQRYKYQGGV